MQKNKSIWLIIFWLSIALGCAIVLATSVGSAEITSFNTIKLILSKLPILDYLADDVEKAEIYSKIIFSVRLPRICMAAFVGCGLSIVGATFQGLFRNPLADPHIIGVSSGAALGATLAMLTGISFPILGIGIVGISAFAGALVTVFIVYHLARIGGKNGVVNILLTGTATSTFLSSMIALLMTFYHNQIEKVYLWTLGSFSSANWNKVVFLFIFILIGCITIIVYARDLNVLVTGEEVAKSLGIDTEHVKKVLVILSALVVAACVAVSGIIGFVGLIVPHCVRMVFGPDHRRLLPISCFVGAIFMIICDAIARTIASPREIPVGVITAIIGAPYFIYLLYLNYRAQVR